MRLLLVAFLFAISYAQTAPVVNTVPQMVQYGYEYERPEAEDIWEAQAYQRNAANVGSNVGSNVYSGYEREYEAPERPEYEDMFRGAYNNFANGASANTGATVPNVFYNPNANAQYYGNAETMETMGDILEDIFKRDPEMFHTIVSTMETRSAAANQQTAADAQQIDQNTANAAIQTQLQNYPWINELMEEYPDYYNIAQNFATIYGQAKMYPDIYKDIHKYEIRYQFMQQQRAAMAQRTQQQMPTQGGAGLKLARRRPAYRQYYGPQRHRYGYPQIYGY